VPISKELSYIMAGGIGFLLLKEAIAFIRWAVEKLGTKNNPGPSPVPRGMSEREMLSSILAKLDKVDRCVGQLKVEFAAHKTTLSFLSEQAKNNSLGIRDTANRLSEIGKECATRLATCSARFDSMEREVRKTRRRKSKAET